MALIDLPLTYDLGISSLIFACGLDFSTRTFERGLSTQIYWQRQMSCVINTTELLVVLILCVKNTKEKLTVVLLLQKTVCPSFRFKNWRCAFFSMSRKLRPVTVTFVLLTRTALSAVSIDDNHLCCTTSSRACKACKLLLKFVFVSCYFCRIVHRRLQFSGLLMYWGSLLLQQKDKVLSLIHI